MGGSAIQPRRVRIQSLPVEKVTELTFANFYIVLCKMARKVSSIRKSLKLRSRKNGGRKPKSAKRVVSRGGKRGGTRKNFGKRRTGGEIMSTLIEVDSFSNTTYDDISIKPKLDPNTEKEDKKILEGMAGKIKSGKKEELSAEELKFVENLIGTMEAQKLVYYQKLEPDPWFFKAEEEVED